ncbi:c-type cytochrome [Candidatus Poribacteria bacterium]|nr:c-type cytochrome [Candidatus Poribacteria bacterium]
MTAVPQPTPVLSTRSLPAIVADGSLFLLAAGEGVVALALALAVAVPRTYFPIEFSAVTALVESGWPLLSTVAVLAGAICCALAMRAILCGERLKAVALLAVAIVAGADFMAVRVIESVRLIREHRDLGVLAALTSASPVDTTAAEAPPDPARGKTLFSATCAACHGPGGEGKARQGAPLLGSAFLKGLDDTGAVEFLKAGRTPADPKSIMRMVMPPRGGNPTLTDADLRDVAAFAKTLASQAAPAVSATAAAAAPAFEIHRSVNPPASAGPSGLSSSYLTVRGLGPRTSLPMGVLSAANRFPKIMLAVAAIHGLLVLGGLCALAMLLAPVLRGRCGQRVRTALFLACAHFQMMAVIWLLLVPFLYGPA